MKNNITHKSRDSIIRIVAISVCVLELVIFFLTLIYQQDVVNRIETPITAEIAQDYMNHPENLKPGERLSYNSYGGALNQQNYVLVKEVKETVAFPWKAWILISVGTPIGIAFLVLLLTKAYFQAFDHDENGQAGNQGKVVSTLNRLSQINIIWFMLLSFIIIFLFWYIPESLKYTGGIAMAWLTRYWWIPALVLGFVASILFFWIYLQYKLRVKAMNMEMELTKFKLLQFEGDRKLLIDGDTSQAATMLEGTGAGAKENTSEKTL